YDDPAAMSRALVRAARDTGIRMTLLPVLYMSGGFDGRALGERQRRFGHGVDAFLRLIEAMQREEDELLRVGCALHSLRAVLANAEVNPRWTLVHATHLEPNEVQGIARSGATVAICPTTEANLGDGLFPLRDYLAAGGAFGIGSDSQVSVSPVEELRWLEYGQRLVTRHRNIAVGADSPSV